MDLLMKRKQESGITLIALIITVIIMLILASVAVSAVINGFGLFDSSRTAAWEYEKAAKEENTQISEYIKIMKEYTDGADGNDEDDVKELTLSYTKDIVSDFCVVIDLKTILGNEEGTPTLTVNDVAQNDYNEYTLNSYPYPVYENGEYTFEVTVGETTKSVTVIVTEIKAQIPDVYVALYTDGTLVFSNNETDIDSTKVSKTYGNIKGTHYNSENTAPWYADYASVSSVNFLNTVSPTNTSSWFENCTYITTIDLSNLDASNVIDMSNMFRKCSVLTTINGMDNIDTSNARDMSKMFQDCLVMETINVGGLDTENVIDMSSMFASETMEGSLPATKLTEIVGLANLNTGKVTNMSNMFKYCDKLVSVDVSGFNTSNVTDMSSMFKMYYSTLQQILGIEDFDTSNVTDMSSMFRSCDGLTSIDVSSFDTSNVTDMSYMFEFCDGLTSIDVSSFDTSNVTDMSYMFYSCDGLTTIYVSELWSVVSVTSSSYMFDGCTNLVGKISYDSTKTDATYANYETGYLTKKEENTV